jgi:Ca-activated chloride channel family protein
MRVALVFFTMYLGLWQPAAVTQLERPASPPNRLHVVQIDLTTVLTPTAVFRRDDDTVVRGLGKDDFSIFEDGIEQPIVSVSEEDAPVTLNILLDTSGSMRPKKGNRMSAGNRLVALDQKDKLTPAIFSINTLLGYVYPEDMLSLTTFATKPVLVGDFGIRPEQIERAMTRIEAKGLTSLNESIRFVVKNMNKYVKDGGKLPDNRILLILSDGEDTTSWIWDSDDSVVEAIRETGLRVYAVGIIDRINLFKKLADATGGKAIVVNDPNELSRVVPDLLREMHNQYQISFNSTQPLDGKYRKIRVTLKGHPEYQVRWRPGYYASQAR